MCYAIHFKAASWLMPGVGKEACELCLQAVSCIVAGHELCHEPQSVVLVDVLGFEKGMERKSHD